MTHDNERDRLDLVARIMACARATYGDLTLPSYGFLETARRQDPYRALVGEISELVAVEDITVPIDNSGFDYLLRSGSSWWVASFSAVGPFGCMFRRRTDSRGRLKTAELVHREDVFPLGNATRLERSIVATIERHLVRILTIEELETQVDFIPLLGNGPVSIYEMLFTDSVLPPWQS